ncbi:response regulator transcription factor [Cystobacter fuscus]|uniref:helix-turn-helix transcriptional regulator n=1 Tax=Cystobacter fuscus TaxID=43 RepID=UPI002B2DB049|nr:response regulator transcription factor [Cystobacter fuscus]
MIIKPEVDSREQALILELFDALLSSEDLSEAFQRAQQPLSRLLPSDSMALCVSTPDPSVPYDWLQVNAPSSFFAEYAQVAEDDFVRQAVLRSPNKVMRDSEMLSRESVRHSKLYQYCRKTGMPADYAMAVMLDVNQDWHGGLTLYREGHRPFSDHERALLQWLTPKLAKTVRDRRFLSAQTSRGHLLDALFEHQGAECIVLVPPTRVILRAPRAMALLREWFAPSEFGPMDLPHVLVEQVSLLSRQEPLVTSHWDVWKRERPGMDRFLNVVFVPLPSASGPRQWAVVLSEIPYSMPLPPAWRSLLTESEAEVVSGVLQGWENQTIAEHRQRATGTVKKQLKKIFDKLGVHSRAALMYRAALILRTTR